MTPICLFRPDSTAVDSTTVPLTETSPQEFAP